MLPGSLPNGARTFLKAPDRYVSCSATIQLHADIEEYLVFSVYVSARSGSSTAGPRQVTSNLGLQRENSGEHPNVFSVFSLGQGNSDVSRDLSRRRNPRVS